MPTGLILQLYTKNIFQNSLPLLYYCTRTLDFFYKINPMIIIVTELKMGFFIARRVIFLVTDISGKNRVFVARAVRIATIGSWLGPLHFLTQQLQNAAQSPNRGSSCGNWEVGGGGGGG